MEEVVWDKSGKLRTYSPSTYKIPAVTDTPDKFNVEIDLLARYLDRLQVARV